MVSDPYSGLLAKTPIICFVVSRTVFASLTKHRQERMNGHGFCDDSVLHGADYAVDYGSRYVHRALNRIDVTHFKAEQLALPQAVDTARGPTFVLEF